MPMRTIRLAIACAVLALALGAPLARADVAGSIAAELTANGVPSPSVSVSTPAAGTAADVASFAADPSQTYLSLTPYNLLSADPTAPQPVATISFTPAGPATPLPGSVAAPGEPGTYVQDSQVPIWNAAIMQAVKHVIAGGATLAGTATFGPPFPGRDTTEPEAYSPVPDPTSFSAAALPQTLSTGAVQMQYQVGLPAQYSGASVTVADAAGGQRVVTLQFNQPAAAFANDNLGELTEYASKMQSQLDDPLQGGNIGEVIVKSNDPASGNPLFTHASDATWGQRFEWSAPSVRAFTATSDPDAG
jgi:hypothetical protein